MTICLCDNSRRVGWVLAIDSVTYTAVLQERTENLNSKKQTLLWDIRSRSLVPVTESSEDSAILSVMAGLLVESPHDSESCRCSNEIVSDRIQKLIRARKDMID
ncbi:gem-associated protein 6-like [Stylophora pistillata]|uniref:gem-associated protein 6-like n=1 Tax=Stylophora pistillata TaxID=50429 RepID=UPI000C038E25|nr:gem-associated protein 6-like [Stylophora pistillata]